MPDRTQPSTRPPSQNAVKHGAEAAIKRLADGKPFTGLAAAQQAEVRERLETEGIDVIMESNAVDTQAVRDLILKALIKAFDDGNEQQILGLTERYKWFDNNTLKNWVEVKANRKKRKPVLDGVLKDYDDESSK